MMWVFTKSLFCVARRSPEILEGVWSVLHVARTIICPWHIKWFNNGMLSLLASTSIWISSVRQYKRRPAPTENAHSIWNYTAIYMSSVIVLHPLRILWQPLIISTFCLSPLLQKTTWILWAFNHHTSFDIGDSSDKGGLHYTIGADKISEPPTEKRKRQLSDPLWRVG